MKIMKVFVSLSEDGLHSIEAEWEFVKETQTYYEIKSELNTKRLKKEDLNKIQNNTINSVSYISFYSFCEVANLEIIKEQIIRKIKEVVTKHQNVVQKQLVILEQSK